MTDRRDFADKFHATYTKSFVESLLLKVLAKEEENKIARNRSL